MIDSMNTVWRGEKLAKGGQVTYGTQIKPNIRDVSANMGRLATLAFPCMFWHAGAEQMSTMLECCKFCKV